MSEPNSYFPVMELRVVFTAQDYDSLIRFYGDRLELETTAVWPSEQGRAAVLDMGQVTLFQAAS